MSIPQINAKVYIEGDCFISGIRQMFAMAGCTGTNEPDEADLIIFSGGADIDPGLYGDKCLAVTSFSSRRDDDCKRIFDIAQANNIPMFGICRGMQFLHAMAGGTLYQDVKYHAGNNHLITVVETGEEMLSSSLHHQMCRVDNKQMVPLAYASEKGRGDQYTFFAKERDTTSILCSDNHLDLEAAAYPDINAVAVQGHPELLGRDIGRFVEWSLELCNKLLYVGYGYPSITNPAVLNFPKRSFNVPLRNPMYS